MFRRPSNNNPVSIWEMFQECAILSGANLAREHGMEYAEEKLSPVMTLQIANVNEAEQLIQRLTMACHGTLPKSQHPLLPKVIVMQTSDLSDSMERFIKMNMGPDKQQYPVTIDILSSKNRDKSALHRLVFVPVFPPNFNANGNETPDPDNIPFQANHDMARFSYDFSHSLMDSRNGKVGDLCTHLNPIKPVILSPATHPARGCFGFAMWTILPRMTLPTRETSKRRAIASTRSSWTVCTR